MSLYACGFAGTAIMLLIRIQAAAFMWASHERLCQLARRVRDGDARMAGGGS